MVLLASKRRLLPLRALAALALALASAADLSAQARSIPRIVNRDGRYALIVDGAPFLVLGLQTHNSSAWPSMLSKVWPAAEYLHANTLEAPIYWEQFEPRPGVFDDSSLNALLAGARKHHLRLVLLWFGTWKNGSGHYTPSWMKEDNGRYPHVIGHDGRNVDSLSPFGDATLKADCRAFSTLMRHLKAADPQHTTIMVQVENEAGSWGSVRDYGPAAEKAFAEEIPSRLQRGLETKMGTWRQVFGDDADEFFHAWSIASYINHVAASGKAEYPLPMYVNTALRDPLKPGKASEYESGGPTDNVIALWKIAASSIDLIAPDIYMPEYPKVAKALEFYSRSDNPLYLPEIARESQYARYFFAVLGHNGFGFSPFGMDYSTGQVTEKTLEPFAVDYRMAEPMQRELALLNFEGKLQAVAEDPQVHDQTMDFAGWRVTVNYGRPYYGYATTSPGNPEPAGGVLVAQLGPDEFLVSGEHARVDFSVLQNSGKEQRQYIRVEEGAYKNGKWMFSRVLNGDQTDFGLNFSGTPDVLKVTLGRF